ncbi:MAG: hypothetical protein GX540_06320, partial [Clostridiales bacterium]|nr:hypothetical protein [Clostridiales bacterium]
EDLIALVSHTMGLETLEPLINARFSANVKAEQMHIIRVLPLFLKSAVLKMMYRAKGENYMTSTLSNLGLVKLPPEMAVYTQRLDLVLGAALKTPINCSAVSAVGKTTITFSKTIREAEVERVFFTTLIALGVPVTIESNWRE